MSLFWGLWPLLLMPRGINTRPRGRVLLVRPGQARSPDQALVLGPTGALWPYPE